MQLPVLALQSPSRLATALAVASSLFAVASLLAACGKAGGGPPKTPSNVSGTPPPATAAPSRCSLAAPFTAPAGAGQDAWGQVRSALGPDIALRPVEAPEGWPGPQLVWLCSEAGLRQYTVAYGDGAESLAFCLEVCGGDFGNFGGPPTSISTLRLRGTDAKAMTMVNVDDRGDSRFSISWVERGRTYVARLTSARLSLADLASIVAGLVAIP